MVEHEAKPVDDRTQDRQPLGAFLVNEYGDRYFYEINGSAFDKLGSSSVFRRQFGDALWQPQYLNLVIGSDSGLLIEHVRKHGVPEGAVYIFIEPDGVVKRIREQCGSRLDQTPGIQLTDATHWESVAREHRIDDYIYKGRLRVLRSIGASEGHLAAYTGLYWSIKDAATVLNWRLIGSHGNAAFIRTELANLAENRIPAIHLKDSFCGKTAVLFGGGPSFDELLPWVREHRDQLLVIAVSRVCRQLVREQFPPDIVVSLDPHEVSFDVSKELLLLDPDVLFVAAFHANPKLTSQWPGRIAYLGPRYPWHSKLNPTNVGLAGPTVTNTALQLAVELGCAQVVLGGVDLCFSREGFTHARGSNERKTGPLLGPLGIRVETNDGGHATSRQDFVSSIGMMGTQAEQALTSGCQVINPAPRAARIPNVEYLPPEQIGFEPLERPAAAILDAALPEDGSEQRSAYYRQTLGELDRIEYRLGKVRELVDEGLACNDGLFGRNGKKQDFKYKKRMDKVERILNRRYGDITVTVRNFGDSRFLRLIRLSDKDWSDAEIEQMGRDYYETYRDSVDELRQEIKLTRRRLETRLEEEQPTPDFTRLIRQWRQDGQPGRARVWRLRHPNHDLPATASQELDALRADFDELLANQQTGQKRWCEKEYNLAPVRGKALFLLQHQDREELERLAEGLAHHDGAEAEQLQALIQGYMSELGNEQDEALTHYQRIIDAGSTDDSGVTAVLLDALARVAQISLARGDGDNALLALECLAGNTPAYQPFLAEVLRLTGQVADAISIYHDYLQRAPNDLGTMLRLGRLYLEIGSKDSARVAFEYILERDPEDVAANTLLAGLNS